jgi:hypothetical protein
VAIRNLEECGVWKSGHKRQTDDLLVKLLHSSQIGDAERNLANAAHAVRFSLVDDGMMNLPQLLKS